MKKNLRAATLMAAALIAVAPLAACGASTAAAPASQPGSSASAPAVLPVTSNPMSTSGTKPGLSLTNAIAENNVDPKTKAPVADRLQFTVTNSSPDTVSGLAVYYTMKDVTTGKTESYFQKLTGVTLKAGQAQTIYFDNGQSVGHYPENKYSLYRSSTNKVTIAVQVGASGYATATGTAVKSPGTGEKLD
ncbi:MAG: hypothetical protein HIU81_12945 [Acidobacteria bacterium]|nr:hypothetical protein [Acidobacteriota bacterium]